MTEVSINTRIHASPFPIFARATLDFIKGIMTLRPMTGLDHVNDHYLRDIGLTRNDIAAVSGQDAAADLHAAAARRSCNW